MALFRRTAPVSRIDELKNLLAKDPASRQFLALADEYRKLGRLRESQETLERGLQFHPNHVGALVALGKTCQQAGRLDDAIRAYQSALRIDGQNLVAIRQLADVHLAKGEKVEAVKRLKLYRGLNPGDREVAEMIGWLDAELQAQRAKSGAGRPEAWPTGTLRPERPSASPPGPPPPAAPIPPRPPVPAAKLLDTLSPFGPPPTSTTAPIGPVVSIPPYVAASPPVPPVFSAPPVTPPPAAPAPPARAVVPDSPTPPKPSPAEIFELTFDRPSMARPSPSRREELLDAPFTEAPQDARVFGEESGERPVVRDDVELFEDAVAPAPPAPALVPPEPPVTAPLSFELPPPPPVLEEERLPEVSFSDEPATMPFGDVLFVADAGEEPSPVPVHLAEELAPLPLPAPPPQTPPPAVSETLAELYVRQGYVDDARSAFRELAEAEADPDRAAAFRARAASLDGRRTRVLRLASWASKWPEPEAIRLDDLDGVLRDFVARTEGVRFATLTDLEGLAVATAGAEAGTPEGEALVAELTAFWKGIRRTREELGSGAPRSLSFRAAEGATLVTGVTPSYALVLRVDERASAGRVRFEAERVSRRLRPALSA